MKVFISYRRSDTQDLAGRIADRLRATPGIERIFIDVEEIEPGVDFETKIRSALADCEVCVLLIGPRWLGIRDDGSRSRIFDARDFVRLEASAALASGQKVLPVLANEAQMPQDSDLPEDLQQLPRINALSVRHAYFDHDIEYLIDTLLSRKKPGKVASYFQRHPIQAGIGRALSGMLAALALLIAGAAVHGAITRQSLEETLGGPAQVWLLAAAVLASGAVAPLLWRPNQTVLRK